MKSAGSIQINPIPVIIAALLIVVGLVYVFWVGPARSASQAEKNWTTAAAVEERMKAKSGDASYEQQVKEALAKEGRNRDAISGRRGRD